MTSPFTVPDWVPPWVQLLLLILAIMLGLAFALMPFSVFGVKSRLEALEARLDEIQGEIRVLSLRLPERNAAPARPDARPPIPPAAWAPDSEPRRPIGGQRIEPRIDRK